MLISKKYLTPELVHVFEVHEFEGVLVGAAAAHHGVDLGSTLLGSGQREYYPIGQDVMKIIHCIIALVLQLH